MLGLGGSTGLLILLFRYANSILHRLISNLTVRSGGDEIVGLVDSRHLRHTPGGRKPHAIELELALSFKLATWTVSLKIQVSEMS